MEKAEKSQKSSERVVTEADIDWAYGVISQVNEAIDKATGDAGATNQLIGEVIAEMPNICEALVLLVEEEHRGLAGRLITSMIRWVQTWEIK